MSSNSDEGNAAPKVAKAPFGDAIDADLVIRSADGVHFYVYKILMSLASPVFRDMFNLPKPEQCASGPPEVDVTESSEVLEILLPFIDPRAPVPPQMTTSQIAEVFRVTEKYQIGNIRPKMAFYLSQRVATEPVETYLLAAETAAHEGWANEVAHAAARQILEKPLAFLLDCFPSHASEPVSSAHLIRLMKFHAQCAAEAQRLTSDLHWYPGQFPFPASSGCTCGFTSIISLPTSDGCMSPAPRTVPHWWADYAELLGNLLAQQPLRPLLDKGQVLSFVASSDARACLRSRVNDGDKVVSIMDFNTALHARVKEICGKADLGFEADSMPFLRQP